MGMRLHKYDLEVGACGSGMWTNQPADAHCVAFLFAAVLVAGRAQLVQHAVPADQAAAVAQHSRQGAGAYLYLSGVACPLLSTSWTAGWGPGSYSHGLLATHTIPVVGFKPGWMDAPTPLAPLRAVVVTAGVHDPC